MVPARDHIVASQGMHSAKEMEAIMRQVADEVGADESQIRIDTFAKGKSPFEVNPRHSADDKTMFFRGERHKFWGGWSPRG